jgi:hypothetical protein
MNLIPVRSSNVRSIGYENGVLEVHFHDSVYQYLNVPPSVFDAFLSAESKGRFVHRYLKGVYRYKRL